MSKSIYEEAIEILSNMGTEFISVPCNPIGEENSDMIHLRDVTETYETNMHEVVKSLEQAQKQEKLLNQIKDIINRPDDSYISSMLEESKRYVEILKLIREIENE